MAAKKRRTKTRQFDFDDEESVRVVMAEVLDTEPNLLRISEDRGLSSFQVGTFYKIDFNRSKEYVVARDEEEAEALALAIVTQDLEESPENFEPNFVESHIDLDQLRRDLTSDVEEMAAEDLRQRARREAVQILEEADGEGIDVEKYRNDDGDLTEPDDGDIDDVIDKLSEKQAESRLEHPMDYLRDIYGDDAVKKAIDMAGIDVAAAADEAVSTDGYAHFLGTYDGKTHEGPHGLVYWRTN